MELPDGYRWTGRGLEMVLIDPLWCPAGHPFEWGQRGPLDYCELHGQHNTWRCECSQQIWRVNGEFVGERC